MLYSVNGNLAFWPRRPTWMMIKVKDKDKHQGREQDYKRAIYHYYCWVAWCMIGESDCGWMDTNEMQSYE